MQQKNNKEDQGQVIILFQDMLEVVTRDIMDEQLSGCEPSYHSIVQTCRGALNC
jgi:callose synthase